MSNEQLAKLWEQAGMVIDEQRLRIFRLMTASQQREILAQIEREQANQTNKNKGILT
ncbi:MAG: hypothetical protein K9M08_08440 [Pirellula sp.]|nr:hypothetical protein [Pirellula sp.]